jgi:Phosphotransferase enzyme family
MTERHLALESWLDTHHAAEERQAMARRIHDLLRAVHEQMDFCHRDVHIGNIVVTEDERPLLIGPKWTAPSVNDHCYDLEGPNPSGVPIPEIQLNQGHPADKGVWWGSPVPHRALSTPFGLPPTD